MELSIESADINNVDEVFYAYIFQHNKEHDSYHSKCHFCIVLNDNQYSTYVKSNLFDNKTKVSRQMFSENKIDDFKIKGYNFNHFEELNIISIANKTDMSYDFAIKHNVCAVEWKLNALINTNKNLINKVNCTWRHPLKRKIESYPG